MFKYNIYICIYIYIYNHIFNIYIYIYYILYHMKNEEYFMLLVCYTEFIVFVFIRHAMQILFV